MKIFCCGDNVKAPTNRGGHVVPASRPHMAVNFHHYLYGRLPGIICLHFKSTSRLFPALLQGTFYAVQQPRKPHDMFECG